MAEYFDNDWEAVSSTPPNRFISPPAQAVLDRASSWELPHPYSFIVRSSDPKTYKTIERSYRDGKAAKRFVDKEVQRGKRVIYYSNSSLYEATKPDS